MIHILQKKMTDKSWTYSHLTNSYSGR